jgi:hypothetical protein
MFDGSWDEKLNFLVQQDHQMKNILLEKGIYTDCYHPELEKVHINNARRLQALVKKFGFPVLSNAGEQAVRLSWLIIYHSISLPDFMRTCLLEMRLASGQQDYILELLAHTEDKVAFLEGRPQLYGTHADWIQGDYKRTPIEDVARVDIRRKGMGLPPLHKSPLVITLERPPRDQDLRDREFKKWLVRVGWQNS